MASVPPSLQRCLSPRAWTLGLATRRYATSTAAIGADAGTAKSPAWPHQPQFGSIHDDRVARLAAKPLHPLSLADLVK